MTVRAVLSMILIALIPALCIAGGLSPALEILESAMESFEAGDYSSARVSLEQLWHRMPHKHGLGYDLALAMLLEDSTRTACDSILSMLPDSFESVSSDSMASARAAAMLASGMDGLDSGKVQSAVAILRNKCVSPPGATPEDLWNLEVALDWLRDQSQSDGGGQEEQQEDQGQSGEDQQEEQPSGGGQEEDGREPPPDDREEHPEEESRDAAGEERQERMDELEEMLESLVSQQGEMTPEEAQAILDLIEEAPVEQDSTSGRRGAQPAGPEW
ncbi:hypothetical protein JW921_03405 [Candidatus Fermentibacterales bacterium]|nr:hypothetical protein [Candidatus Fermentibacterales bacterium]